MGLIGGIVGGIGSAVGGIVGGRAARRAARRNAKILADAEKRNKAWYDREYNSNFLQRADAQAAINKTREMLNERYNASAAAAAVSGATDEAVAQQKLAANEAMSGVMGSIAERADAYKEQVRANYENKQAAIDDAKMGVNNQRAQATAQAASGLAGAAQQLGSVLPF